MSIIKHINSKSRSETIVWVNKNDVPQHLDILNERDLELFDNIKNENRKKEFYGVRWLLNEVYPETSISYSKTGKPVLSNGKEISISHSGEIIAIATTSNQLCGIDVQELTEKTIRLREKFLNEEEKILILENDLIKTNLAWSSKETLFKMIDKENVPFKSSFNIEKIEEKTIKTKVTHPNFEGEFDLNYKVFDTFVMVYYT